MIKHNERKQSEGCGFKTNFQTGEGISGSIKTKEGSREYDTYVKVPTYGNSRLNAMIADGKIDPEETLWIDCYNQRVDPDIAGTILARVNATGHYLVSDPRGCAMRGRPDASGEIFSRSNWVLTLPMQSRLFKRTAWSQNRASYRLAIS